MPFKGFHYLRDGFGTFITNMISKFTAIFVLLFIHSSVAGLYDLFTPESRLSGFVIEKISPIGIVMCVRECSKRQSCASLNFHRGRLECELSFSDVTVNPFNMTSDSEFIYIGRNQIPQVLLQFIQEIKLIFLL